MESLTVIEQATALIQMESPPADIEDRLKALENKADEFEQLEFVWIWEAWAMRAQDFGTPEKKKQ